MIPINRPYSLKVTIEYAKKRNWCIDYLCTTCGSRDFRLHIKKLFNRTTLIEELRKLDANFVDEISNRSAILLILDDVNQFGFDRLITELENTPAGFFLKRAINIENERISNHRQRMLLQEQNRKN